jgi:DNA invertase Pin-like site-specific DNA recombinase
VIVLSRKINKVAIYSRKSRPDETEDTLKKQLRFLMDKCEQNGWDYDVFQEIGSSQTLDRLELTRLLNRIQDYVYDAIVITDQDRLSRTTGGFAQIKDILIEYNVLVITSTKIYDYATQEDDLMSDMQSIMSKQEYMNIKKRLVRGMQQSAKGGNWASGSYPFGYTYDHKTKKLTPDENADTVKLMYKLYLENMSTRDIAHKLNMEGRLTLNGKEWSSSTVSRTMRNPVYKGVITYNKTKRKGNKTTKKDETEHIVVEDAHEKIISVEEWEMAQQIRDKRSVLPPALKFSKNAFSGLIKCHKCGKAHQINKRVGDAVLIINSCRTRNYFGTGLKDYAMCGNTGGRLDIFEEIFYSHFSKVIVKFENYLDVIKRDNDIFKDDTEEQLIKLKNNQEKIKNQIKKVQSALLNDIYTEQEAKSEIKKFREQLEYIANEITELSEMQKEDKVTDLENIIADINNVFNNKDKMDEAEINRILSDFIDGIIYKKDKGYNSQMELKIVYKGQQI